MSGQLTPTHLRILKVLIDPTQEAETAAEIAKLINSSASSVGNLMQEIYAYFGAKSMKGMLRRWPEVAWTLGMKYCIHANAEDKVA